MKVHSTVSEQDVSAPTPASERKTSKFAALGRLFKPWKWKRRKKPSENIHKKAVGECVRMYVCASACLPVHVLHVPLSMCIRVDVHTCEDLSLGTKFSSAIVSPSRMFCVPNNIIIVSSGDN